MSLKDRIKARVLAFDAAARPWAAKSPLRGYAYEFLLFGLKQAWASLFGATMLAMLVATNLFWPADAVLARYDALFLGAFALQGLLLATRLERWDEAAVICVFHLVGTAMEVFKTAHGSWTYPEAAIFRIGGAPLFAGFMYASVGSYIARAWRLMDLRFIRYPPLWGPWLLAILAYANFFAHHYLPDIRIGLYALSAVLFGRAWFVFTPGRIPRRMPMLAGFALVALFVWLAENIATFAGAWTYPSQRAGWTLVSPAKLGAWYLLMMLSFVLVTIVHRPRSPGQGAATNPLS
ncbi:DUF817 domain-containing protein [Phenylobacterium immobile]|uniref:DUF817 domain-containing protein n=1 Tax=Phenylobacterium immobile TaxID=21 RepID=UPI000B805B41|nr:DUF817 domain-containing protein [Phenylobacterium immobile]